MRYFFLFFLLSLSFASSAMGSIEAAEKAFQEKNFLSAYEIYWKLYREKKELNKAALLYNAGISAFQGGKKGLAYALFLKAQERQASDTDILYNLNFVEKILTKEGAFISSAPKNKIWNLFFKKSYLSIYLFLSLVISAALLLQYARKTFFPSPTNFILSLLLLVSSSFTYISNTFQRGGNAIVLEKTTIARSGPGESFPEVSTLKEGSLVEAKQSKNKWKKVYFTLDRTLEPAVAWIPEKSLFLLTDERIRKK